MGNSDSINFSLSNIFRSWYRFRRGKRTSSEILTYQYSLEDNLYQLSKDLNNQTYRHGSYDHYTVEDSKKRDIAVAGIRDRVVHRLMYDYLTPVWDKTFIFDAWSCRKDKGLHQAVARSQKFMSIYSKGWFWRSDITKFFDSVDQATLLKILERRVFCPRALWLAQDILSSYHKHNPGQAMPIGNLTSQIFANIYLNEFDRYMVHSLKPNAYLRYGDDWLCFANTEADLNKIRDQALHFLSATLQLNVSKKIDSIKPVYKGFSGSHRLDYWCNRVRMV